MNKGKLAKPWKLVITTNIAECGINLEADAVVDVSKNFYYIESAGVTSGQMNTITMASRIQRRGRVGRKREGTYYFTEEPEIDTASQYDAHIICRNLTWYDGPDLYPTVPKVSRQQASISMKKGIPPRIAHLLYNHDGTKKYDPDLTDSFKEWQEGNVKYEGCKKRGCKCPGMYTFWDERYHDEIFES